MKIFTSDIKLVDELTRYVRIQDIEKARFKKFNTPKINDGNLACDEFFRTEELFDRKKDVVTPFTPYSVGDVPVIDRTSPLARDIQLMEGSNSAYIESDLPYYVDIIGEKKRIYIEDYGTKSPKYPYEADFDASGIWTNRKLYQDCSIDDIVNIRYFAKQLGQNDPKAVEWQGLKLLHDGFPLEAVINIMKEASTKSADGQTRCSRAAMQFVADYPKLKRYMITYANDRSEIFDTWGAKMFTELLESCGGNEKLAYRILWDCRVKMQDGSFLTDPDLLQLGLKLYKKNNVWSEKQAEIVQLVSLRDSKYYKNYANKVLNMQNSMSLDEIIAEITPKSLRKQKQ